MHCVSTTGAMDKLLASYPVCSNSVPESDSILAAPAVTLNPVYARGAGQDEDIFSDVSSPTEAIEDDESKSESASCHSQTQSPSEGEGDSNRQLESKKPRIWCYKKESSPESAGPVGTMSLRSNTRQLKTTIDSRLNRPRCGYTIPEKDQRDEDLHVISSTALD